jgi:NAD(P)-dependent dehydrogenase (short-subunit alcohol dehydrogenase family)
MAELLADKIAIVSGAAHPRGIGRAIFNALTAHGATVMGTDLTGAEFLDEIPHLHCDVTDVSQVEAVMTEVVKQHGKLDIVVNNAGVGMGSADFMQLTDKDWEVSLAVNLMGIVNSCKAAIPHMLESGGSIINVASLAGTGALGAIPACYTASKFAAVGLTKQLATQYAANNIRVNALCPGSVITQMHQGSMALLAEAHGITPEEAQELENANIPLGRSAQPEEVGNSAVYLASDLSSYVTGVSLPVAGGMAPGL